MLLEQPFKIQERRKKGGGKKLSVGQKSSRQRVGSHRIPSWFGMRAGKQYRNVDYTSPVRNSQVEEWEKKCRNDLEQGKKYTYTHNVTLKKLEDLNENEIKKIAKQAKNEKWKKPERIKKRIKKITEKNPETKMIMEEKREILGMEKGSKYKKQKTFGQDLHFILPPRSYNERKRKLYKEYRGESSESSDEEII